ncbi:MAG: aldehyde dehydrogenase family protein [Chloroflexaceae bacterium]|nr:aldehyde dehydrogenase family protein [Chloroflexaceae bacterium]
MTVVEPPVAPPPALDERELARRAVELAADLLHRANDLQTPQEYRQARKIARMMEDPNGKALTIALSDQVFRSHRHARIADQLEHLLRGYGVPTYMAQWEQGALWTGGALGKYLPDMVVPPFASRLRQETRSVILPGEERELRAYLKQRRATGTRLNLNQLGEAILGEGEARRRLDAYLTLLAREDVEYISVKLSSVFSQINLIAYDHTLTLVKERLRELYRTALQHTFRQPDGSRTPKFINLDMEEYRDLHFTVQAFREVLDEPEFTRLRAGLVLQAYLPDSFHVQQELTAWAQERVARGGAPIKIRIVKGANLAMEQVEAAMHDWPQAPYTSKLEVDANFKRMVVYGCNPAWVAAVNLGVASHNLFDIGYAILVREHYGVEAYVEFEMLEGMANHQSRAVQERAGGLLLYAPVVKEEDFHSAIAYLVRRLDENTAEENFLHDLFGLQPGTDTWEKQRKRFLVACELRDKVRTTPRRTQDRRLEEDAGEPDMPALREAPFRNVADTDWALPANQAWVRDILSRWRTRAPELIPLQIGGDLISTSYPGEGIDPSRPNVVAYRYALADHAQINRALDAAVQALADWSARPLAERRDLLIRAGYELQRNRGDLLGAMILDGGKAIPEADAEVSEAIDFANYYARTFDTLAEELHDCRSQPLGVIVITPPWNFPLAIPCGGVLAALIAGNTVILKPAPEATLVGWHLAQTLWAAGIPRAVLQFVPAPDNEIGQALVTDDRVGGVILTGSRATALMFQGWKPDLRLFAETSGKNSLIITGLADHDQAIKDLVRSAFGHNGQKCSAASLAVLEAEVYDSPAFRRQLADAAASLTVGSAWDPASKVTPLTQVPSDNLRRALTSLDTGETWLLEPHQIGDNPRLWSPGIKIGVQRGSFFHQTECFGPVLGLMRADDLAEAVELANDTHFGLTGGIHSLDDREIAYWQERVELGNAYINRHITGAIVQRQPFGGWKGSVFGPGAKAGGPNYVLQLLHWDQEGVPAQQAVPAPTVQSLLVRYQALLPTAQQTLLQASAGSYAHAWATHFSQAHDVTGLYCEANIFRYRPCRGVLLRATTHTELVNICQVALAARTGGVPLTISLPPTAPAAWQHLAEAGAVEVIIEDEMLLVTRLQEGGSRAYERLRTPGSPSAVLRRAAQFANLAVLEGPVLANGRLELRTFLREQAISQTLHRYGNILPTPQA